MVIAGVSWTCGREVLWRGEWSMEEKDERDGEGRFLRIQLAQGVLAVMGTAATTATHGPWHGSHRS